MDIKKFIKELKKQQPSVDVVEMSAKNCVVVFLGSFHNRGMC